MKIHAWQLLKCQNISFSVNINDSLKNEIKDKIGGDISSIARELKIEPSRLYEYFIWKKSSIPLKILFCIANKIKISKEKVEANIQILKQLWALNKNSIKDPTFPIEVNPYLTSIVANLFFDGSVPEDGKGTYYNQKNKEIMEDFIKKVKTVFGEVHYTLRLDHRGVLKCRVPRLIGEICRHIYDVKSFGTFNARVPHKIFGLNKRHKEAFVTTAVIDEGSIAYDGSIIFGVSNKQMAEEMNQLCLEVGLKTTGVKNKKDSEHYYFYITSKKEFKEVYIKLNKQFPLINLRHKFDRLKKYFEISNQKFSNTKDFANKRKNIILTDLKIKKCSINDLSSKNLINPRSLRRYMYLWMKRGVVMREKKGDEYLYYLTDPNRSIAS